jgi:uncharacterized protein YcfJ
MFPQLTLTTSKPYYNLHQAMNKTQPTTATVFPIPFPWDRLMKTSAAIMILISLSGCANDQQRTVTQGTAIGAVGGAIAGAGLGALTGLAVGGGNTQSIINGMIIGGATGAAAGGYAGYKWGQQVAIRKSEYASSEAYLQANIAQAQLVTAAARKENAILTSKIAGYNRRIAELSRNPGARPSLMENVNATRSDLALKIKASGNEIQDRQKAVSEVGSANEKQVEELVREITALKSERAQLQQNDSRLAAISSNLSTNGR